MKQKRIIKALECCSRVEYPCNKCPLRNSYGCATTLSKESLDLLRTLIEQNAPTIVAAPKCVYSYDGETMEYCTQAPCPNYKTVEQIRAEVAREIFADLEQHYPDEYYTGGVGITRQELAELKQKYEVE